MIKSLRLQNFESHEDTLLEFAPGVNAIVGESDSGKSAIIRALVWLATNRPTGDAFRRHGAVSSTSVKVVLDDGTEVTRAKTEKQNIYYYKRPGEQPVMLKAFGQDVPKEISDALNLLPVNFQPQFDAHFLLPPVPAGEVARRLNEVVDLQVIDHAQASINRMIRENEVDTRETQGKEAAAKEAIEKYNWVEQAEADLKEMERVQEKAEGIRRREAQLRALVYEITELEKQLKDAVLLEEAKDDLLQLIKLGEDYLKKRHNLNGLSQVLNNIKSYTQLITEIKKQIEADEKRLHKMMPDICPLCGQAVAK